MVKLRPKVFPLPSYQAYCKWKQHHCNHACIGKYNDVAYAGNGEDFRSFVVASWSIRFKIKMWQGDFCDFLACSLFLEPNSCRILHHKTVHQHCNLIVLTIVYMVCIHAISIHAMAMAPRHTTTYLRLLYYSTCIKTQSRLVWPPKKSPFH